MNDKLEEALTIEELKEIYTDELARKDNIIKELREENAVLMRMSVKGAEEKQTLKEAMEKLME